MAEKKKGLTYAEAGVDIDAGEREVELIKKSLSPARMVSARSCALPLRWASMIPSGRTVSL